MVACQIEGRGVRAQPVLDAMRAVPRQFDEYIWFDATSAPQPLDAERLRGMPDTYRFGLQTAGKRSGA